ncbi:ABC transporter ATP-binding protein [Paenibacillus piscarius]|uniref:ABC transporter ATP-binding protein n=1 Tax=Paenibacillus piscarius TaxID=1089681 RepID=UPI001EE909EA|nr:ATP-binding cassette domain-containing protein [Paenibacillus piscarius]
MNIIKVENLTKTYRNYKKEKGMLGTLKNLFHREFFDTTSVNMVNFDIAEGEVIGFLGPNGAGKTTTLKMLSGILHPTLGTVSVMGYCPWERNNEFRRQISIVMGQKNQLWWDLPSNESFELNKAIYQIDNKSFTKILNDLVEILGVGDLLKVPVRTLSLGERMKMELIGSLLHDPKVIFLDEPTIGLDLVSQKKIQEFILEYNRMKKVTIVLTSHYMNDIDNLCKRLIVINKGSIIYDGSLEHTKRMFSKSKVFKITFAETVDVNAIEQLGEIISIKSPYEIELKVDNDHVVSTSNIMHQYYKILDISINDTPIEDVILETFNV